MISNTNLGALMGAPIVGPDDERIGTVAQVFVDPNTGSPNWVTVHTGLFGRHESFVPLDGAEWDHEELRVNVSKDLIKDAPRIAADEALGAEEEDSLYRHYGLGTSDRDADASDETDHGLDQGVDVDADQSAANAESDEAAPQPSGDAVRLRKYVVTDDAIVTVPVEREELRVEPESADAESEAEAASASTAEPQNPSDQGARHRA